MTSPNLNERVIKIEDFLKLSECLSAYPDCAIDSKERPNANLLAACLLLMTDLKLDRDGWIDDGLDIDLAFGWEVPVNNGNSHIWSPTLVLSNVECA